MFITDQGGIRINLNLVKHFALLDDVGAALDLYQFEFIDGSMLRSFISSEQLDLVDTVPRPKSDAPAG